MTAREDGGGTPLHIAALDAQAGTAKLLVDAGVNPKPALESIQEQMDRFFSQLPYKCYLEKVASVGD